jgi:hypothetical protein
LRRPQARQGSAGCQDGNMGALRARRLR